MASSTETQPIAQVLLLGTFHFQDAGLDWHQPQHDIAILSDQRQQEIDEVITRLCTFAPTKIAVERRPDVQIELDHEYREYLTDSFSLPGSEVYQLGFRLAKQLGHQRIYGIDAWGRYYDPPLDLEPYGHRRSTSELNQWLEEDQHFDPIESLRRYAHHHGQVSIVDNWEKIFSQSARRADEAKTVHSIRESLVECNREQTLLDSHGLYLTGWFSIGVGHECPGVDWVTAWSSRNLRIFATLQRITEGTHERILVIYGVGHIPILQHCVLASPEYTVVDVQAYLA